MNLTFRLQCTRAKNNTWPVIILPTTVPPFGQARAVEPHTTPPPRSTRYVSNHSTELFLDPATMATRKGPDGVQIVAVFSNQGEQGGEYELSVGPNAFETGTEVIEVFDCTKSNANEAGNVTALMGAGLPKVFFPTAQMEGSGLCGYANAEAATNTSSGAEPSPTGAAMTLGVRWSTVFLAAVATVAFRSL
jgi:hypothetical protein